MELLTANSRKYIGCGDSIGSHCEGHGNQDTHETTQGPTASGGKGCCIGISEVSRGPITDQRQNPDTITKEAPTRQPNSQLFISD